MDTHVNRQQIESIIKMRPKNLEYYQRALVHKSILKTNKGKIVPDYMKESNERLEYLGDSVLSLVVATHLYNKYTNKDEGFLTKIRTKLVRGKTLAMLANKLSLDSYLLKSSHVKKNDSIMENAYESLIGAIYLDLGYKHAEKFILENYSLIDEEYILNDDNYKDQLLRYTQANYSTDTAIKYEILEQSGPPHDRQFTLKVIINDETLGKGKGRTKKEAEQNASLEACKQLNILNM